MIEAYFPSATANRWGQIVREELRRRADPATMYPQCLESLEVLLWEAGKKIKAPIATPRSLSRFPLFAFKPVWRMVVWIFNTRGRNQRTVNTLLLQANQEALAVLRSLAAASVAATLPTGNGAGQSPEPGNASGPSGDGEPDGVSKRVA
jgi:hypothetical protein